MKHATLQHYRKHVDYRLLRRLFIYILISLILVCLFTYHIVVDNVSPLYPFISLVIGFFLGMGISRAFSLSWDKDARKVISRIDIYGTIIIIAYIIFASVREQILAYFVQGPVVLAVSFAFAAGIMFGRAWGIHGKISQVIGENI